jgi:hypothetical protein
MHGHMNVKLAPYREILVEKLILFFQLAKKLPARYARQQSVVIFARTRYFYKSSVRLIQSTPTHPVSR